jgi:hypothetical protein
MRLGRRQTATIITSEFSIYSTCQAIFFCNVKPQIYSRDRSEMYLCLHSSRSEFTPTEVSRLDPAGGMA